jgi:hypothetical protein
MRFFVVPGYRLLFAFCFLLGVLFPVSIWGQMVPGANQTGKSFFINDTSATLRIDGESYTDITGVEKKISVYWMFSPNQRSWLVDLEGKHIPAKEIYFKITSLNGQGVLLRGVGKIDADGDMTFSVNEEDLKEEQKRGSSKKIGTLYLRVPEDAVVLHGEKSVAVSQGVAIVNSTDESSSYKMSIAIAKVDKIGIYQERASFRVEPGIPLHWDFRDMANPNKKARTSRYVSMRDKMIKGLLLKAVGASDRGTLVNMTAFLDGLPARGIDEDAVKCTLNVSAGFKKLLGGIKEDNEKTVSGPNEDILRNIGEELGRTEKILEARYGDDYVNSLSNGGIPADAIAAADVPKSRVVVEENKSLPKKDVQKIRDYENQVLKTEQEIQELQEAIAIYNKVIDDGNAKMREVDSDMSDPKKSGLQKTAILLSAAALQKIINDAVVEVGRGKNQLKSKKDHLMYLKKTLIELRD